MNLRFTAGLLCGVACTALAGFWIVPTRKADLEHDVLYTWPAGNDRRVDLAVQDDELMLYVGSSDQQRPFFQLIVKGDAIATYHALHYGNPPGEAEDGINLDSQGGRITKFTATLGTSEPRTYLFDTDDDLRLDQRLRIGSHVREAITWTYAPLKTGEGTPPVERTAGDPKPTRPE